MSEGAPPAEAEILLRREGGLGVITLNRPRAMNALTHGMLVSIARVLDDWEADSRVAAVAIRGAGDRGLCAGGDIVTLYHDITGDRSLAARFWADEYALNSRIASYSKPYVALMDGVVLGGGVGISAHGSVRVVTERTRIGMPEVGIGFVPDVGGTWLLSRAPGELGTHAGLTGGMFSGSDAIVMGLADHYVPSDRLDEFLESLRREPATESVERFAQEPPASALAEARGWIDAAYSSDDPVEIVRMLAAASEPDARAAASEIEGKSPLAVAVTLESLRRARRMDSLDEVLEQEYRVALHCAEGTELVEGIRAQVIDKDRRPSWSPRTLGEVDRASVESYFAPLTEEGPGLSLPAARLGRGGHQEKAGRSS